MTREPGVAERRYLWMAALGTFLIGLVGLTFAAFASSQAILLDGLFNLSYSITGLFTLKVASLVRRGDDQQFPLGYVFFEPLINGFKGVLVLGLSIMALAGAIESLVGGGRAIAGGPAILYGLFATVSCWTLAIVTRRGAKQTGSPLIRADAENWLVNAAISSAVLLAFIGTWLLERTRAGHLAVYVDPLLVIIIVLISISVPIRMAWHALMQLLNRTAPPAIVDEVRSIVADGTSSLPVREFYLRVVQPGRLRWVIVHLVLPTEFPVDTVAALDAIRERIQQSLSQRFPNAVLDMIFTADEKWGAPATLDALTNS